MAGGLLLPAGSNDLAWLCLAAVQGIPYGAREILEAAAAQGHASDTPIATEAMRATKSPCGSAIAAGLHPSVPEAMAVMTRPGRVVPLGPAARALHAARFRVRLRIRDDQRAHSAPEAGAPPG